MIYSLSIPGRIPNNLDPGKATEAVGRTTVIFAPADMYSGKAVMIKFDDSAVMVGIDELIRVVSTLEKIKDYPMRGNNDE